MSAELCNFCVETKDDGHVGCTERASLCRRRVKEFCFYTPLYGFSMLFGGTGAVL